MGFRIVHQIAATVAGTGVDTFVLQLCGAQRRLGHEPTLTAEAADRESFFEVARTAGVAVAPLPRRVPTALPRSMEAAAHLARQAAFVRGCFGGRGAQLLHLHVVGGEGLPAYLGALGSRVPLVVTHHTTLQYLGERRRQPQVRLTLALERRRADRMVFAYHRAQAEFLSEGVDEARTAVIPFCADETVFCGAAAPPVAGLPFRLLVSSRLVPGKGHADLLDAVASLGDRAGPLEVLLVGDGPTRPALEAQVARLGLGGVVRFLGLRPHADLPGLLRSVHAIVLPTHMEGETFPVSLLEAACLGLPAIGTRWFGIPDIIADGTSGLLVEPRDPVGLAAAIAALAADPALWARLAAGARARAEEHFTATRVAARYDQLYRELISAGRAAG